jgi:hypothetical protein
MVEMYTEVRKMAKVKFPIPTQTATGDISDKDSVKIQAFIDAGHPGLVTLTESTLYRMADLYLSGHTYWQISNITGAKRDLVMYVARKYGWFDNKQEYIFELQEKIKGRVIESKLVSQDFLLLLNQTWQKRISKKLHKYLATGEEKYADEIDLKEVAQLLKTIEMVNDLDANGRDKKGNNPAVGLNLGEGVTIERNGDKVTITPKEKSLGDMLKKFADDRRAEAESLKPSQKRDIDIETTVIKETK